MVEQISYAKTVYGQEEINAVVKCLSNQPKWVFTQKNLRENIQFIL